MKHRQPGLFDVEERADLPGFMNNWRRKVRGAGGADD
jgi:hypothetical protein